MNEHRPNFARGFTLVELLVVIGIIAMLIGILLPTLAAIQNRAKVVVCHSNLKQIYTGLFLYANDNKDIWPGAETLGRWNFRIGAGMDLKNDPFRPDAYSRPETLGLPALLHGLQAKEFDDIAAHGMPKPRYLDGRSKIWICPAYREDLRAYGNTYAFNVADIKDPMDKNPVSALRRPQPLHTLWRSKNPDTAFVWDNNTFRPGTTTTYGPFSPSSQWTWDSKSRPNAHRIGKLKATASNFLFVDGHIELRINEN